MTFSLKKDLVETYQMSAKITLKIFIYVKGLSMCNLHDWKTMTGTPVLTQNVIHNFLNNSQEYKFSGN